MKNILPFVIIIFLFCSHQKKCAAQNATFDISYIGSTEEVETAITYAADIWSQYLVSDIPVKVLVHFQLLTPGLLGITFPNGVLNFDGAEVNDVWYPTALANAMTSTELNAGFVDIEIYLNSTVNWYTGTDGEVPTGKYDLVTVALHEMGHGLGIIGLANKIAAEGSFGMISADLFSPLTTSFTWPDLDTLPSIFDTYLEDASGNNLITYPNPSADLGTAFTGNDVWFNSPLAVAANGGERVKIYAPASYALGSSMTHLNESTFPAGDENELMTPNGTPGSANQNPGAIVLGILNDIGWEIIEPVALQEADHSAEIQIRPNPVFNNLHIESDINFTKVEILNINGEIVFASGKPKSLDNYSVDVSNLIPGVYFMKIFGDEDIVGSKFFKL